MNKKPIAESDNVVLSRSYAALLRAAQDARERARRTHTRLIVSRNGKVCRLKIDEAGIAESPAEYGQDG